MESLKDIFLSDWRNTLEEALAIAAITWAYIHARHLKQHTNHLKEQLDRLEEVRQSLPTQHLSKFPDYIEDIVRHIKNARKEVVIVCDYPAYGVFSNANEFLAYTHAIEDRASRGVRISLTCLDEPQRHIKTEEEFAKSEEWNKWLAEPTNVERAHHLLSRYRSHTVPASVTRDEIVELLGHEDKRVLADTFATAEVSLLGAGVPLYFWLIDGSYAVFAIPSYHERALEHGFYTQEPRLIEGLLDIRDRYLASATSHTDAALE
jgi:hypothetical protein